MVASWFSLAVLIWLWIWLSWFHIDSCGDKNIKKSHKIRNLENKKKVEILYDFFVFDNYWMNQAGAMGMEESNSTCKKIHVLLLCWCKHNFSFKSLQKTKLTTDWYWIFYFYRNETFQLQMQRVLILFWYTFWYQS